MPRYRYYYYQRDRQAELALDPTLTTFLASELGMTDALPKPGTLLFVTTGLADVDSIEQIATHLWRALQDDDRPTRHDFASLSVGDVLILETADAPGAPPEFLATRYATGRLQTLARWTGSMEHRPAWLPAPVLTETLRTRAHRATTTSAPVADGARDDPDRGMPG
jgi:hypothetical protein